MHRQLRIHVLRSMIERKTPLLPVNFSGKIAPTIFHYKKASAACMCLLYIHRIDVHCTYMCCWRVMRLSHTYFIYFVYFRFLLGYVTNIYGGFFTLEHDADEIFIISFAECIWSGWWYWLTTTNQHSQPPTTCRPKCSAFASEWEPSVCIFLGVPKSQQCSSIWIRK